MDHCLESAALSADFQIRSHQDMPPHSCCDKGAALLADHAVLGWSRAPAGACSDTCAFQRKKCFYLDLAGLTIKTLNSSVIILAF